MLTAHDVTSGLIPRTSDVLQSSGDKRSFADLHLPPRILDGLSRAGFMRPSPVQAQAVPGAVMGVDMMVQAKSGTGKTLVFVVAALAGIDKELRDAADRSNEGEGEGGRLGPKVLVIAPTREIAVQGTTVAMNVAKGMKEVKVQAIIGGMSVQEDVKKLRRCHMVVGTPGRVKQMIQGKHLKTEAIRLFALDEADKLMGSTFYNDITWLEEQTLL